MLAIVAFRSAKGAWIERSFRGAKGDNRRRGHPPQSVSEHYLPEML
jgi:hypothetical protein